MYLDVTDILWDPVWQGGSNSEHEAILGSKSIFLAEIVSLRRFDDRVAALINRELHLVSKVAQKHQIR